MSAQGNCCDDVTARGSGDWLALAATPVFAIMAAMTVISGDGTSICSLMPASPLGGMTAMYALMSAFHAAPWLKRLSSRR